MSNLFNSQQNININISYNLAQEQLSKPIIARKVQKFSKINGKKINEETQPPLNHPNPHENLVKLSEQLGELLKVVKGKKKTKTKTLNTQQSQERRLKTQNSQIDQYINRKDHFIKDYCSRTTQKSVSNAQTKKKQKPKPKKASHINSCIIYSSKKHLQSSNIYSSHLGGQKKKRALSAVAMPKKDKIVSKLLNMSVLSSDIGGSQGLVPESNHNQQLQKIMRDFLTTLDMRLVNDMRKHNPNKIKKQQKCDLIDYLQNEKRISHEVMNKAAIIIQRAWKKQMRMQIINFYGGLFSKAIENNLIQNGIEQIKTGYFETYQLQQSQINNQIQQGLQQKKSSQQQLKFQLKSESEQQKAQEDRSCNIKKYKQLVNLRKTEEKKQVKFKQEQMEQWNNINKLISSNMKNSGILDSQKLLDELMKQSTRNKQWIQGDGPAKQSSNISSSSKQKEQIELSKQKSNEENDNEDDSVEDQVEYNWNKYDVEQGQWDSKWIKKQFKDNEIMRDFVDCGLHDFGVNISYNGHFNSCEDDLQPERIGTKKPIVSEQRDKIEGVEENCKIIIQELIKELAQDIGYILSRSSKKILGNNNDKTVKKGISTSFPSVRDYLIKLKDFILQNNQYRQKVIENLNRQIGPSSLEILSYLRVQMNEELTSENEFQSEQGQDHLYVIPIHIFQKLQIQINSQSGQTLQKNKHYGNFFNQSIFQSYNQCLDFQKPYGINGRPYAWVTQPRMPHFTNVKDIQDKLMNAMGRVLELTSFVSGIIFQKDDSPFANVNLQQQHKQQINEQRLSRILANELFDAEQSWINYEDEKVELLAEVTILLQSKIIDEMKNQLILISKNKSKTTI